MANYYEMCVSNDFRVKEPKKVVDVLDKVYGITMAYVVNKEKGNVCFGNYQSDECLNIEGTTIAFVKDTGYPYTAFDGDNEEPTDYIKEDEIDDYTYVKLLDFLQDQLIDDKEYILITTIGNEKLRYVGGDVFVITKNATTFKNLYNVGQELVESLGLKFEG